MLFAASLAGCTGALRPLPVGPSSAEDGLQRATRQGSAQQRASALRRLERLRFQQAQKTNTVFSFARFLQQHPQGVFAERARERLALGRFAEAERQRTAAAFQRFLRLHPQHPLAARVWRTLLDLQARQLLTTGSRRAVVAFLRSHPGSDYAARLRRRWETLDHDALGPHASQAALEAYLRTHPGSPHGAAVRRRLEERLADRVAAFGDGADLRQFLERFPASGRRVRLEAILAGRALAEALRGGDAATLRVALSRTVAGAEPARRRILQVWLRAGVPRLVALWPLFVQAMAYRPEGRPAALLAASRLGDPPTAAYALTALAYWPRLAAARALLQAVASPDAGVSLAATRSLVAWGERASLPARRALLDDLRAELEARSDGAARVGELALRLALGDREGLRRALGARTWHRPWDVLPHVLWLEIAPPGTTEAQRIGQRALAVFQDELRRLGQMLPRALDPGTRRRAVGALHELERLEDTLRGLLTRHPRGTRWTERLHGLAEAFAQRAGEARRAVSAAYPDHRPLRPAELEATARRHRAGQQRALETLRRRLGALRLPREVSAAIIGALPEAGRPDPRK